MKLTFEHLEDRTTPTTAADIAAFYVEGWNPMPGVPLDKVGVVGYDADPTDGLNPITDLFYALDGGAPRLRAIDTQTGEVVFDEFVFDPALRSGITSLVPIGQYGYATVGEGGGPVVAKINLNDFSVSYFAAEQFPESWRHGLKLYAADVDSPSRLGGEELIVLPAGDIGGPVVHVFDPDSGTERFSFLIGPSEFRGEMEAVPAGLGVQLASGRMGGLWQQAGKPETTVSVAWDGTLATSDYREEGNRIFFTDPIEGFK